MSCPDCGLDACGCCEGCDAPPGARHQDWCWKWAEQMKTAVATTTNVPFTVLPAMTSAFTAFPAPEDAIVCPDEAASPGDAPSKCDECGATVFVPASEIARFAGEERPRKVCKGCATVRVQDSHAHVGVPNPSDMMDEMLKAFSEGYARKQVDFADAMRKTVEAGQRFEKALSVQDGWHECGKCRKCGGVVSVKGRTLCAKCQMREWRRGR